MESRSALASGPTLKAVLRPKQLSSRDKPGGRILNSAGISLSQILLPSTTRTLPISELSNHDAELLIGLKEQVCGKIGRICIRWRPDSVKLYY